MAKTSTATREQPRSRRAQSLPAADRPGLSAHDVRAILDPDAQTSARAGAQVPRIPGHLRTVRVHRIQRVHGAGIPRGRNLQLGEQGGDALQQSSMHSQIALVTCELCGGYGLIRVPETNSSRPCECQIAIAAAARIKRAGIPAGFAGASFRTFQRQEHTKNALQTARRFCEEFLPGKDGRTRGMLLTGSVGTGKTHLAVACLRHLIEEKGIDARFVDVRDLLERLRSTYRDEGGDTQTQILKPLLRADLVVIDELGAARPTDWVFETIELLIGGLYNSLGPVIVTTNLPNAAPGATTGNNEYQRAARPETLGDRIGARMWSRLQEMCVSVEMIGKDFRSR